jgi:diguanylate cyclase (GGDEF)-like protein
MLLKLVRAWTDITAMPQTTPTFGFDAEHHTALDSRWRHWLLAGIGALLAMIFLALGLGYYHIRQGEQRLALLTGQFIAKQEHTQRMFQASQRRTMLLQRMLHTDDPFLQDALRMEHHELANEFAQARRALLMRELGTDELQQTEHINRLVEEILPLHDEFMDLVFANRKQEATQLLSGTLLPAQDDLLHALGDLVNQSRLALRSAQDRLRGEMLQALWGFALLGALILLLGVWLAWQVVRQTQAANALRERLALHDPLTGLPNRQLLCDRIRHAMARAKRRGTRLGVMFVDLDKFKPVNDSLGHAAGDELLRAVAERLRAAVRAEDTVARLGGDEFVVLAGDAAQLDHLVQTAENIIASLQRPFTVAGQEVRIGCSIGMSVYPGDADRAEDLLHHADLAMYHAKEGGRGRLHLYDPDMNLQAARRLALETALHQALEQDQFVLHYQPQVLLPSGETIGVEALIRWQHPERRLVSPAEFLPLAEQSELILEMGRRLLAQACRHAVDWHRRGHRIKVAFNLSGREFWQGNIAATIAQALEQSQLPPEFLQVELTEGILVAHQVDRAVAIVEAIAALGVRIAVDDFGTGHSSLAHLKRFPIHVLKIDRQFVQDIERDTRDQAIVRAILALANTLGLEVVTEGVETEAQVALLRELGCTLFQGYHVSRPLSAEALLAWLQQHGSGCAGITRAA